MMSFNANGSRESSSPSLSQVVALSMTYRLLLKMLAVAPVAMVAVPLLLRAAYFVFDRLTNNHTILSLLMTWAFTEAIRKLICQSAPSKERAHDALAKTEVALPCLMFSASAFAVRIVVTPLEDGLGIKGILTWSPTITFSFAFRLAIGMLLLGMAVILRFVGPPSIVRCSTSPLLAHPFTIALRRLRSNFTVDAMLDFLAGPSENPGELIHNPLEYRGTARRLQHPTWTASFSQILISSLLSVAVAYTSVLPFSITGTHGDSPYKAALIISCIAATLIHLMQTALNGSSHELNPNRYQARRSWNWPRFTTRITSALQSLIMTSLAVTCVAILASFFVTESYDQDDAVWSMVVACLITASVVTLYLHLFDEALRTLLCSPPIQMRRIVEEAAEDDRMETYLDVAMYSLLHSDAPLVKDLISSSNPGYMDLEREERRRNETAIKAMANTLLHKTSADETGAHLEEDILRLAILASLGGKSWNGKSYADLDRAEAHHVENIKQWVQPRDEMKVGGSRSEPVAVPLVRALCAFAGGLGEALIICSGQKSSPFTNPWLLPPGAIVCAEYAIRAAARCIVLNLSLSTRSLADWRSTHLSIMVPVFLTSAYRLESGMVRFTQGRSGGKPSDHLDQLELFRTESPEFLPLYHACNDSAAMILEKLKSLEGVRRLDFDLDTDCQKWTNKILARIPSHCPKRESFGSAIITFNKRA